MDEALRQLTALTVTRLLRAHARLVLGVLVMAAVALVLPASLRWSARALLAWDAGVLVYLAGVGRAMRRAEAGDIRQAAKAQDEGRAAILSLTALAIGFSFVAIAAELHAGGAAQPTGWSLALAAATIALSWIMTQVVMATHYASAYYRDPRAEGGLDFPGGGEPDYLDFLYFAFTMGAACQTSDVSVTARGMRALVLAHTALAFLFNTLVLALAVNVGASLV